MTTKPLVWIIDDDRSIRWVLEKALAKEDYELRSFESGEGVVDDFLARALMRLSVIFVCLALMGLHYLKRFKLIICIVAYRQFRSLL